MTQLLDEIRGSVACRLSGELPLNAVIKEDGETYDEPRGGSSVSNLAVRSIVDAVLQGGEAALDDVRKELECSISGETMTDPVAAKDGRSYERKAILGWKRERNTSPYTREDLEELLYPNMALRRVLAVLGHKVTDLGFALVEAASNRNWGEAMRLLQSGVCPNATSASRRTALHYAARRQEPGAREFVVALLGDANFTAADAVAIDGCTALHEGAIHFNDSFCCQLLQSQNFTAAWAKNGVLLSIRELESASGILSVTSLA
jgi:hypothetical protein